MIEGPICHLDIVKRIYVHHNAIAGPQVVLISYLVAIQRLFRQLGKVYVHWNHRWRAVDPTSRVSVMQAEKV